MLLCHYDGILISEEEDAVCIEGERRIILLDDDISYDLFESQIGLLVVVDPPILRSYSLKCEPCLFAATYLCRRIYL